MALWNGRPLIMAAAGTLARAGCDQLAAVVSSEAVAAMLPQGFHAIRIEPGQDMSASFHAACRYAETQQVERILIALGDMPALRTETLVRLLDTDRSGACHLDGARTPPASLLRRDWQKAMGEHRDRGARSVIAGLPASALLALSPDKSKDIDTRRDLEKSEDQRQ